MQVTETLSDDLKREYKVVIAAQDLGEKLEARLEQIGRDVRVPGFRPGKVPMKILRQRFSQSVMGEVIEQAVRDSSAQALNERGLRPALQPRIEIARFEEGKDLEYKIALELLPDIEIADLTEIELERLKVAVPDEEIERTLERLASAKRETKPLAKARSAAKGDVLVIDFRGSVDGEEFPGMAAEDHHLELGSDRFIEGFENQLIGAEAGEDRDVKVRFPDGYVNPKLAGREAIFAVKIKEIREPVPQPVDDALARDLGESDLQALKAKVRQQLQDDYGVLERAQVKRALLDALAERHEFSVPPSLVENEFESIWPQIEEERREGRADPEDEGKSDEELKAEYRGIAERRVRLGLLLSEVGRVNGIEVSQEELNRAIMTEAQSHPGHEREIFDFYHNTPEALASLRAPIFEDKVVDFILDLANVTERGVSLAVLRGEEADDKAKAAEGREKSTKATGKAKKSGAKAKATGKAKKGKASSKTKADAD